MGGMWKGMFFFALSGYIQVNLKSELKNSKANWEDKYATAMQSKGRWRRVERKADKTLIASVAQGEGTLGGFC